MAHIYSRKDELADKARIKELEGILTEIANLHHHGGLMGLNLSQVSIKTSGLTIEFWDKDECAKLTKPEHMYKKRQ